MEMRLDAVIKRGRGYWLVDGFAELITGALLVLLGLLPLLRGLTGPDTLIAQFVSFAGDIAIIKLFGVIAALLLIWWLKDHFTYPRTGWVRGRRWPMSQVLPYLRNILLLVILPVLALLAAFFLLPPLRGALFSMPIWLPALLGIVWGGACLFLGRWAGLRRFQILGVVILLIGVAMSIWQLSIGAPAFPPEALQIGSWGPLPETLRLPIEATFYRVLMVVCALTLGAGAALVVSGLVTFLRYRKENPLPYEEES